MSVATAAALRLLFEREQLAPHDLRLVAELSRLRRPIAVGEAVQVLGLSPAQTYRVVKRLTIDGYVHRVFNAEDGRRPLIEITRKGVILDQRIARMLARASETEDTNAKR